MEQGEVPDKYFARVFWAYTMSSTNHIGIYRSLKLKKTEFGQSSCAYWIGLNDPVHFYMFDEISVETFSKYVPTQTTEGRWNAYIRQYNEAVAKACGVSQKHYSFNAVFNALKERGYICRSMEHLDTAVRNAALKYLQRTVEFTQKEVQEKTSSREKFDEYCGTVSALILEHHAFEHIETAWIFTDAFWQMKRSIGVRKEKTLS